MKRRLIKKAYAKALNGEHTRIRPNKNHGKAIAIFHHMAYIGACKDWLLNKDSTPVSRMGTYMSIVDSWVQIEVIKAQPVYKTWNKGSDAVAEKGNESIMLRNGSLMELKN